MHREACEATHVRGEQSTQLLELRTACLAQRLGEMKALATLFAHADEDVVRHAVDAVYGLPDVAACADVAALTATPAPPADARARIETAEARLTEVRVLELVGKRKEALDSATALVPDVKGLYAPLEAELILAIGDLQVKTGEFADAEASLVAAYFAADDARADEVRAEASLALYQLVAVGLGRIDEGVRWGRRAAAIAERLGVGEASAGTFMARLWTIETALDLKQTRSTDALEAQKKAVAALEKTGGPKLAEALKNLALVYRALGREQDARETLERMSGDR
jgi:tetratricopeptide (TPR) repeat protein